MDAITIPVPGTAELHLSTRSGRVSITAEERDDVLVESDAPLRDDKVQWDATGRVAVKSGRGGSGWLELRCPTGSDVAIGTVSGVVALRGQFGSVKVLTVSGAIEVDRAEALDARSVSGNIEVARCSGQCRLTTKSGRAICGAATGAQVSTLSGQIKLGEVAGNVSAQSASGRIEVALRAAGDVTVQTMSGAVTVQVPPGLRPHPKLRSLASRPRCEVPEGNDCEIRVQSLSGSIEVVPA
jgi:DUF4097 and DUF4098 domain-containing protein YvlB